MSKHFFFFLSFSFFLSPLRLIFFVYPLIRSFTCLCYAADGESILAGGQSKFVCIYNVKEQMLMKKFEISCNLSFDAMEVNSELLMSEHNLKVHAFNKTCLESNVFRL